jgi:hypothetical protein
MTRRAATEWSVTLRVTLDPHSGAKTLREWLREHGAPDARRAALDAQLATYLEAVLTSNSDWDGVQARFSVKSVNTDAEGDP